MDKEKIAYQFIEWLMKQDEFANMEPQDIAKKLEEMAKSEEGMTRLAELAKSFEAETPSYKKGGKVNKKVSKLVKKCQNGAVRVFEYYTPHRYEEVLPVGSGKTIVREVHGNGDTIRYLKDSSHPPYLLNDFSEQVDSLIDANMPPEDPNAGKLYYGMSRGRYMRPTGKHIVYRRDTVPGGENRSPMYFVDNLFPQFEAESVSRVVEPGVDTIYMRDAGMSGPGSVINQRGLKELFNRYFNSDLVVPEDKGSYLYRQRVRKQQEGGEFEIDGWKEGIYPSREERSNDFEEYLFSRSRDSLFNKFFKQVKGSGLDANTHPEDRNVDEQYYDEPTGHDGYVQPTRKRIVDRRDTIPGEFN